MNRNLLPGAALMSLVSGGANAATVPIESVTETASAANPAPLGSIGLGTYNPLGSPTGVGGINGPIDFTAPFAGTLVMTVGPFEVDGAPVGFAGAVYQAFVNGASLGFTKPVPLFGTNFSTGTFTVSVPAGTNNFNINDQLISYIGQTPPHGSAATSVTTVPMGFSSNTLTVTLAEELPSAVPEPRTLALLGAWLLGLSFLWRQRKAG
jgi:hypothetical protein